MFQMGHTSLHMASHRNDLSMLTLLLGLGADVNSVGFGNQTPLMECCYNGNLDGAKLLINAGADVNAINAQSASMLHLVARGLGHPTLHLKSSGIAKDRVSIVLLLLKAGVDPSLRDNKERTALEECIMQDGFDCDMAKVLLKVSPPPQFRRKSTKKSTGAAKDPTTNLSLLTLKRKDVTQEILIATLKEQTRDMSLSRATTEMISEKALEEKMWQAVDGKL